jgi:hypothetical protein
MTNNESHIIEITENGAIGKGMEEGRVEKRSKQKFQE